MDVPGSLRGFAAKAGSQSLAIYLTPDHEHVVVGTLVDAAGQDMAAAQTKKILEKPILEDGWKHLEQSTWVTDGKADAPRVVYAFTDPNAHIATSSGRRPGLWSTVARFNRGT